MGSDTLLFYDSLVCTFPEIFLFIGRGRVVRDVSLLPVRESNSECTHLTVSVAFLQQGAELPGFLACWMLVILLAGSASLHIVNKPIKITL